MDIKYEIENFISANQQSGALLLTGKWGCGKTYLLKMLADQINSKDEYLVVIISLFGKDNIDMLHRSIKESVMFSKSFNRKGETAKSLFSKTKETAGPIIDVLSDYSKFAKGLNTALSINWQDLISISREVECYKGKEIIRKKLVLVFDDFERSKIETIELMGAINDYTENKGIKTIIVADEYHVKGSEYNEFKEKLIARTVRLVTDTNSAIRSIVTNYIETTQGYCLFLKRQLPLIEELFAESGTENLRSLKSLLFDFERVFTAWKDADIPTDFLPKVFYSFGAMIFTIKSGKYKEDSYGNLFADDAIRNTFKKWDGKHALPSLRTWLVEGIWNTDEFNSEITTRYGIQNMSNDQKFLMYDFWAMDHEIITQGMPLVVANAYVGNLSRNDIKELLIKVYTMKNYGIPLPCEVNYENIASGFSLRKKKIKSGEVEEPKLSRFTFKHQTESTSHKLCDEMIAFEDQLTTIANRQAVISYFKPDSTIRPHQLNGLIVGAFDNQLLEWFWHVFTSGSNIRKRDAARVILNLGYRDKNYVGQEELEETVNNFAELQTRLSAFKEFQTDCMTIAIINETIKEIQALLSELQHASENDATV